MHTYQDELNFRVLVFDMILVGLVYFIGTTEKSTLLCFVLL